MYGGYGDLYQMLLEGKIDLLAGLAWREERTALVGYPDGVMGSESYLSGWRHGQRVLLSY